MNTCFSEDDLWELVFDQIKLEKLQRCIMLQNLHYQLVICILLYLLILVDYEQCYQYCSLQEYKKSETSAPPKAPPMIKLFLVEVSIFFKSLLQ